MLNRRTLIVIGAGVLTALMLGTAVAPGFATRANTCPGKIVCPLTGELVCRDQCPRIDANRAECPGRIECPLTGGLVCADRCPLGDNQEALTPACCAARDMQ